MWMHEKGRCSSEIGRRSSELFISNTQYTHRGIIVGQYAATPQEALNGKTKKDLKEHVSNAHLDENPAARQVLLRQVIEADPAVAAHYDKGFVPPDRGNYNCGLCLTARNLTAVKITCPCTDVGRDIARAAVKRWKDTVGDQARTRFMTEDEWTEYVEEAQEAARRSTWRKTRDGGGALRATIAEVRIVALLGSMTPLG